MPWPDLRRKHETTLIGDVAKIGEIFAEFWKMNLKAPYYPYLAYSEEKRRH